MAKDRPKTALLEGTGVGKLPQFRADVQAASGLDRGSWLPHNEAAMEGTVIGQYRVTKKLGEGGMGAVYGAEHALLGRKAAIKMLLPTLSSNQEIVQRFFNEARAATAIADPGIVQIFDFGYHTDGSAYIVMEYLEGEPLDSRLKRLGRLNPFDALRIMRQASSSLAAAHSRGIIHRDLKPENIFLVADREVAGGERPKLLDFGIAKLTNDAESKVKTHTAAIMGTPMYMSPEQCRGAGAVDARSDVYALGCVLYHLIVGKTPFDGEGVGEIIASHLREPPPVPSQQLPGLPPELDALILRCLQKQPDQRFQSANELADNIGWLLGASGQPSQPPHVPSGQYGTPTTPTTLSGASGVRWNTGGAAAAQGSYPGQPGSMAGVAPPKSKMGLIIAGVGALGIAAGVVVMLSMGGGGSSNGGTSAGSAGATGASAATNAPPVEPPPPPPPVVTIDAGVVVAETPPPVEIDAGAPVVAATDADSKSTSSRDKKKRDRDKKPDDQKKPPPPPPDTTPKSKCPNPVPGDTDCDGIPDTR
jgi:serine/threonine protein kinase